MKINSYNKQQYASNIKEKKDIGGKDLSNKKEEKNNMNSIINSTDSIEISENFKQINSIKSKIEDGFYDNPVVLKKVAEKIMYAINVKA